MPVVVRILNPWDLQVDTMYDALNPVGDGMWPADGTSLATVADRGKRGNTQSQATAGTRPIFVKNANNNLPAFDFNGSQWMSAADSVNNQHTGPMSMLSAFMTRVVVGSQRLVTKLLSWSWSLQTADYSFTTWAAGTGFSALSTGGSVTANVWQRGDYYWNGSNVDFIKNSTLYQNVALSNINSLTNNLLYFGSRDGTQGYFNGRCTTELTFFRNLATWERMHMQLFLKSRAGV
jgi:hypothetical protein